MRQIWISKAGPPEVLQVREASDPEPQSGEVRIRVKAAGINFADLMAREGLYPDAPKIPCVVGYEASGVIDKVGADVSGLTVGDRVFGMPYFGGYSDTIALPAVQVTKLPDAMTFEEGAALPVAYITAHHMMMFSGALRPGASVLIHSAAGGVGIAAVQIAKMHGAVILGTASVSKHTFLRDLGCQHPIDSSGDIPAAVRRVVGTRGVDLILDPVGGQSWRDGYNLLGDCGRLVVFGLSAAASGKRRNLVRAAKALWDAPKFSPFALMTDNKTVSGTNMAHLFNRLDLIQPQFDALIALYGSGDIKPIVDRTFSFEEAAQAHHYIHDRKAKGKVLLVP